jgi:hypothetical protein
VKKNQPRNLCCNNPVSVQVILYKGSYWLLSLRMSKCIYRHVRLKKGHFVCTNTRACKLSTFLRTTGFSNIQTVAGIKTLRIPNLLLHEKKR